MKLEKIKNKILSQEQAKILMKKWKNENEKVVFTNGCFDLIHPGHITYLAMAASYGTKLIVAINTDASVKRLKGQHRPILDQDARTLIMAAFSFVNAVVLFDEDTPLQIIESLLPQVLVKGKDYEASNIVGADVVIANGGKVETIELVKGYSTSELERRIKVAGI